MSQVRFRAAADYPGQTFAGREKAWGRTFCMIIEGYGDRQMPERGVCASYRRPGEGSTTV